MKFLIASDIHGSAYWCEQLLAAVEFENADKLILLGDLLYHGPRNDFPDEYAPKKVFAMLNAIKDKIVCVRGNCDFTSTIGSCEVPKVDSITLMGKKIVYTHGDLYGVKYGFSGLERLAENTGADLVLFGHTHTPISIYKDGIYYFNPGSLRDGCYGVVDITPNGIICINKKL